MRKTAAKVAGLTALVALSSTVAFGLPWDIDMADSQSVKAYEKEMIPVPSDSVPQAHVLTPAPKVPNVALGSAAMNTLKSPLEVNDANTELGKKMYDTYCTPCHGSGTELGPVSKNGYPGIAMLAGSGGRLKAIPDGRLYVTIRNGYGLMPAYGWAMNDTEMWALVQFARTLPTSKYVPPAPKAEETP